MAFRYVLLLSFASAVLGGDMWDMMKMMEEEKGGKSGEDKDSKEKDWGGWGNNDGWKNWGGWGNNDGWKNWGGWGNNDGWGAGMKFMMKGKVKPMMNTNWMMQQMQQQMQQQQQQQAGWMQEHSQENIDAYMRWCAEKKERSMLMQSKKQFVDWMAEHERQREMEMAKAKMETQTREHARKVKMQYEQWKLMFTQQQHFEALLHKFKYMKSEYMSSMMIELLKFCKCTDVNSKLNRYFTYMGGNSSLSLPTEEDSMFDLTDVRDALTGDLGTVALKIIGMDEEEKTKVFFGSAVSSLCDGAKEFAENVKTWERRYNIWDH